jgi:toxin ParE1/3/4
MSKRLEFDRDAQSEFDDGADWYLDQGGDELKKKYIDAVRAALHAIVEHPTVFPVAFGSNVRRSNVGNFPYVILFEEQDHRILIYSVFHTSRNPIVWRGRVD